MRDGLRRIVAVGILLALLAAMTVHYGAVAADDGHDTTQVDARKLAHYEDHVGERLYFWARVVNANEEKLVVRSAGRTLTVEGADARATPGDVVQVYGTVRSNGEVTADRVIVSKRPNLHYLYAVSAVGLLLVIAAFFREWDIQWRRLLVTPLEDDD